MKLTVGKTTFDVPEDLFDCEDFLQKLMEIAPKAVHVIYAGCT